MGSLDISTSKYSEYSSDYVLLLDSIHFNSQDKQYPTLLMKALRTRNIELAKTLIRQGVKLNEKNQSGCTPLIFAVTYHYLEIVQELIEQSVNLNSITVDSNNSALTISIDKGYNDILSILIDAGANVNHQISNGFSGLMIATVFANVEAIKMLSTAGADINMKNKKGETALILAVKEKNLRIVKLLVEKGADLTPRIGHLWWKSNAMELAEEIGLNDIYVYLRGHEVKAEIIEFTEVKNV